MSNQQRVSDELHKQPATFLTTIGEVMHRASAFTLEILTSNFNLLEDKESLSQVSAHLEQFIELCTFVIENDEFGEAAHAYYWRGMARLKINDNGGDKDLVIANKIFEHWEKEKKAWENGDRHQIRTLHKAFEAEKAEWEGADKSKSDLETAGVINVQGNIMVEPIITTREFGKLQQE